MDVGQDDLEEDDSDEELMDDEHMTALDETLAGIFRSRADERRSKKGIDAQREATHFKNRVLDLVDIYVKREPQSPLNVRLVLPLVELATKSGIDEHQLSNKASGILKSRLVKSKDVPPTAPADEVEMVLREVHLVLVSIDASDAVINVYRESVNDYVSRKVSHLAFGFFQDWARRFPALGWKLRESVLEASSRAVNVYRKCQAFQLLNVLSSHPDKEEEPAMIAGFQRALQKAVLDFITSSIDDDRGAPPAQTKDLLKLVLTCIRQSRKTAESSVAEVWDPTAWKALHDQLSSSDRFKSSSSVLGMCGQIASVVDQWKQAGGKRKAEDEVTESTKRASRKKQRKK